MKILDKTFCELKRLPICELALFVLALFISGCASRVEESVKLVPNEPTAVVVQKGTLVRSALTLKDKMSPVISFSIEARGSDMMLTEVTLETGQDIASFMEAFHSLDVLDHRDKVIAWSSLDKKAFTLEGSEYRLTLSGIRSMIPRDAKRFFTVRANPHRSETSGFVTKTYDFGIPVQGIQCLAREGNYVYGPDSARMVQTVSLSSPRPKG